MTSGQAAPADDTSIPRSGSRRAVAVVVGVVFLDLLGFGIIIPILPFYERSFGVSDVFIGLLAATYWLAQFSAAPLLGSLSDRRGRRPVLMLSVGFAGIAWLIFGVATESGDLAGTSAALVTLFAARLLAGAAGGNIAAAQAYIADVTPPERRAGALGLGQSDAFALGFVFGPAIGGVMASDAVVSFLRDLLPGFVPVTRFSLPSFTAAGLSFAAFGAAAIILEEPERTLSTAARRSFVDQFRDALENPTLRPLVISFFLTSFAFAGVTVMFIPLLADFFGYDATGAAIFLTYIGVLGTLNQGVLVGRLSDRFGPRRVAISGVGSLTVALVTLALSPTLAAAMPAIGGPSWVTGALVVLLVFGALASFGNGALTVGLSTLVSTGATADEQGTAFGVTQGAGSLGRTLGPPLAGVTYVTVYWSPFLAGAVVLLPVLGVLWTRT